MRFVLNKGIKIAYLVMLHRYPSQQFRRLFAAIYHPDNYYAIHVDKKSPKCLHAEVRDFLSNFPNVHVMRSQNVIWGGYSIVETQLRGVEKLLGTYVDWDYFINLSGQDFPLKSQSQMQDFLESNRGREFVQILDQAEERPDTLFRIRSCFVEFRNTVFRVPIKRRNLEGVTPYVGSQWMILSRRFCYYVCHSEEVERFRRFYQHTLIPDEGFFQTVIMNTSFSGTIVNDCKRAIIWEPAGKVKKRPKVLTSSDIEFLLEGENFFGRKFDENVDARILSILEDAILGEIYIDSLLSKVRTNKSL